MSEGLLEQLIEDGADRMKKSVESVRHEFSSVRTGRASPALLDRVQVDYYGAVTPYDKSSIKSIEKAIMESDIGLTPSNDGQVIRLTIPELTEERRKDLVKVVRRIAEEGRVAVRNIRRDVMHDLRELKEAGEGIGSDEEKRAESELQKLTDDRVAEIDAFLAGKEEEILEV